VPDLIRLATVVGARPQFIKAAVVSRVLGRTDGICEDLIHTGQHYDPEMSAVFFGELEIPAPRFNLDIGSGSHAVQTGRMMEALERAFLELRPSGVLLYGDTNSTLAGALAAAKLGLRIAHVEAGLRSFNRSMPEEINRIVADHVADLLFPPTDRAERQLRAEGLGERRIVPVGDVMYDASLHAAGRDAAARAEPLARFGLQPGGYLLVTIHRAENTDAPERLEVILGALAILGAELPVVLPLHPRTQAAIDKLPSGLPQTGVRAISPLGYFDMQSLEGAARAIVTDSGGVQKEAFWHGVPCVTVRGETEWTELIEAGWNRLAPADSVERLVGAVRDAMSTGPLEQPSLYGDGRAGEHIVAALRGWA
jgi:UDP-GlcNAc3NAcA epimerase